MTIERRPNKLTEWASTGVGIVEPSEGKKDLGFIKEAPAYQYFNWIFSNTWDYQKYIDSLLGPLMSKGAYEGHIVTHDSVDGEFDITAGTMLTLDGERNYRSSTFTVADGSPNASGSTRIDYIVGTEQSPGQGVLFELVEGSTPSADQYVLAMAWILPNAGTYEVGHVLNTCRFNEQGHRVILKNSNIANGNSLLFGNDALQDAIDICNGLGGGVVEISGDAYNFADTDGSYNSALNVRLKSGVILDGISRRQIRTGQGSFSVSATVTFNMASDECTDTAHSLSDGDGVSFSSTGTLPPELTSQVMYYVRDSSANAYKLSLKPFGAALNLTGNGTGTITRGSYRDAGIICRGQYVDLAATIQNDNEFVFSDIDFNDYGIGSMILHGSDIYRIESIPNATTAVVVSNSGQPVTIGAASNQTIQVYIDRAGIRNLSIDADRADPVPAIWFGMTSNFEIDNCEITAEGDPLTFGIFSFNSTNIKMRIRNSNVGNNILYAFVCERDSASAVNWTLQAFFIESNLFDGDVLIGKAGSETTTLWAGVYTGNVCNGTELIPDLAGDYGLRFQNEHNVIGEHTDITSDSIVVSGSAAVGGVATFSDDIFCTFGDFQATSGAIKSQDFKNVAGSKMEIGSADSEDVELISDGTLSATIDGSTQEWEFEENATFAKDITSTAGDIETRKSGGVVKGENGDFVSIINSTGTESNLKGTSFAACSMQTAVAVYGDNINFLVLTSSAGLPTGGSAPPDGSVAIITTTNPGIYQYLSGSWSGPLT